MSDNSPLKRSKKSIAKVENSIYHLLMAFIRNTLIDTGEFDS